MNSFYASGAQKRKKDSQVVSLLTLMESARTNAARKYVGEIDTKCNAYRFLNTDHSL
jgi:hypothetical protein